MILEAEKYFESSDFKSLKYKEKDRHSVKISEIGKAASEISKLKETEKREKASEEQMQKIAIEERRFLFMRAL